MTLKINELESSLKAMQEEKDNNETELKTRIINLQDEIEELQISSTTQVMGVA